MEETVEFHEERERERRPTVLGEARVFPGEWRRAAALEATAATDIARLLAGDFELLRAREFGRGRGGMWG